MSIEEKIKQFIVDILDVSPEEVVPDAKFIEDLGADSLDIVEMIMALEDEFSIEITEEEQTKLVDVKSAYEFIKQHVSE